MHKLSSSYNMDTQSSGSPILTCSTSVLPLLLTASLIIGTGSSQPYRTYDEREIVLTEAQLKFKSALSSSLRGALVISSSQQLKEIKQNMGLNIIEIAAILHVSRPTVYDWLSSSKTIRNNNQARIDALYEVSNVWKAKGLHRLGSFLHKKIENNVSLFDLLKSDELIHQEINKYLDIISQAIEHKKNDDIAHERLLKKYSFEPIDKQDLEDRLNDIHFLD